MFWTYLNGGVCMANNDNQRYCSVEESLIESCKEVKLMMNGEKPKLSWKERKQEILKMKEEANT